MMSVGIAETLLLVQTLRANCLDWPDNYDAVPNNREKLHHTKVTSRT